MAEQLLDNLRYELSCLAENGRQWLVVKSAIDEIERLTTILLTDDAAIEEVQAENARLLAALERIKGNCSGFAFDIAREALA